MPISQIPYPEDSAELFAHFAHLPYAIFLDSCHPHYEETRFDIMSAEPISTLTTDDDSSCEPFSIVKQRLKTMPNPFQQTFPELPFTTGALGYFGYDVGRLLETLPDKTQSDIPFPNACIGFYDWSIVVDHKNHVAWLITETDEKIDYVQQLLSIKPKENSFHITKTFEANMTKQEYAGAFEKLQQHILDGDCYEANLCQRFTASFEGSPWQAYRILRKINPAPFAAFYHHPKGCLLSLSPERFLQVRDDIAITKPIKGTQPRSIDPAQDKNNAERLKNSEKDKSENLMVVDLLRNDFGKCCVPGSIQVPKLFALESFRNVHHLVSTITGKLEKGNHALDLLKHCFPGGSITGAPKISAMKIIENLEPHRRSVYCGTIGYFDVRGNMDCNIVIRTMLCCDNKIHCYAGGAIVSDSICDNEYQETLDKVGNLLSTLDGSF